MKYIICVPAFRGIFRCVSNYIIKLHYHFIQIAIAVTLVFSLRDLLLCLRNCGFKVDSRTAGYEKILASLRSDSFVCSMVYF